jgi:GNAT superfamily N-acetyltransferase
MGPMDDHVVHDRKLFIALDGDTIGGSAGWSTRPPGYALIGGAMRAHAVAGQPRIRSVFVHPDWTRRGLARLLMQTAELEIEAAGWRTIELGATLTGVALYQALGYVAAPRRSLLMPNGVEIPFVPMVKSLMRAAA